MKTILIMLGILVGLFIPFMFWCCCKIGGDSDE